LIDTHGKGGELLAGPDCPELYFLTGRFNPSGAMYDFFAIEPNGSYVDDVRHWESAKVVVINSEPDFSPRVKDGVISNLRMSFPQGEKLGRFEVRWR
jgi:galactose mutarotase-like enzyme